MLYCKHTLFHVHISVDCALAVEFLVIPCFFLKVFCSPWNIYSDISTMRFDFVSSVQVSVKDREKSTINNRFHYSLYYGYWRHHIFINKWYSSDELQHFGLLSIFFDYFQSFFSPSNYSWQGGLFLCFMPCRCGYRPFIYCSTIYYLVTPRSHRPYFFSSLKGSPASQLHLSLSYEDISSLPLYLFFRCAHLVQVLLCLSSTDIKVLKVYAEKIEIYDKYTEAASFSFMAFSCIVLSCPISFFWYEICFSNSSNFMG